MQKQIALALAATTSAYALALLHIPHEPNYTWIAVVIGTALCLAASGWSIRRRLRAGLGATWRTYETAVWASFVVGGIPMILAELGEAWARGL